MVERTIGNYRVAEQIGKGGMGHVYAAEHVRLGRQVALKFLAPSLRGDDEFLRRFLREARVMAQLEHPNLVRVLDYGEDDEQPYLVMELLRGQTLRERLRERPLPEAEAVRVAAAVLSGLEAAHAAGVVHRDIKPGNLFLCRDGTVKVMDFGIAKSAEESHLTQTGVQVGTAEYMSPEQAEGAPVDGRSDLYSLGIVLYQMLAGQAPFRGDNSLVVLHQQVHKAPPPLPDAVPDWLRRVVLRALAKKPTARFASAAEMRGALESGLARAAEAAERERQRGERGGQARLSGSAAQEEGETPPRRAGTLPPLVRRPAVLGPTVLVLAAVLYLGVGYQLQDWEARRLRQRNVDRALEPPPSGTGSGTGGSGAGTTSPGSPGSGSGAPSGPVGTPGSGGSPPQPPDRDLLPPTARGPFSRYTARIPIARPVGSRTPPVAGGTGTGGTRPAIPPAPRLPGSQAAVASGWREFGPAGAGFSVLLPGEPEKPEALRNDGKGWTYRSGDQRYSVSRWDVPKSDGTAVEVMNSLARTWRESKVTASEDIWLNSMRSVPGKEMRYELLAKDGRAARDCWARYYALGQQLYQVNVNVPKGTPMPDAAHRFLESFRLKVR